METNALRGTGRVEKWPLLPTCPTNTLRTKAWVTIGTPNLLINEHYAWASISRRSGKAVRASRVNLAASPLI
jgi:hypothetical protein